MELASAVGLAKPPDAESGGGQLRRRNDDQDCGDGSGDQRVCYCSLQGAWGIWPLKPRTTGASDPGY